LHEIWVGLVVLASGFGLMAVVAVILNSPTPSFLDLALLLLPIGSAAVAIGARIHGKTWPEAGIVAALVAAAAVAALLVVPLFDAIDVGRSMKVMRAAEATAYLVVAAAFYEAEVAGLRFMRRRRRPSEQQERRD
jgi:hypothetical protein